MSEGLPARQHGGARPGAGRPAGSQNHVNRDLREYLVNLPSVDGLGGHDAIAEHWRLAALPFLGEDEDKAERAIQLVMRRAGCSRKEAFDIWHREASLVFPKVYPSIGSIELLPPGSLGGAPIPFGGVGQDGEGLPLGPLGQRRIATLAEGAVDADYTEVPNEHCGVNRG